MPHNGPWIEVEPGEIPVRRSTKPDYQPPTPPHPDPGPGCQRPSTGRREDDAEPFPEHQPAVPSHPEP